MTKRSNIVLLKNKFINPFHKANLHTNFANLHLCGNIAVIKLHKSLFEGETTKKGLLINYRHPM
jgi:hypothetical protein